MIDEADNRPVSQIFADIGEQWALAKKHASILRDTRSAFLSQMIIRIQASDSKIALNRAEALAKASEEWIRKNQEIIDAEYQENHLWVKMQSLRMAHTEWTSNEANERTAARL